MTFHEWYAELKDLAKKNGYEWLIPAEADYPRDAYDCELSPSEALADEISYAVD